MSFTGSSHVKLDDKSRLAIPTRIRKELEESWGNKLVVTLDLYENCMVLYPYRHWNESIEPAWANVPNVQRRTRDMQRRFLGNAAELVMDGSGRIRLPSVLVDVTGIEKDLVLVGMNKKFELWQPASWEAKMQPFDDDMELPEALLELTT